MKPDSRLRGAKLVPIFDLAYEIGLAHPDLDPIENPIDPLLRLNISLSAAHVSRPL
jgi:hypothetical protein